MRSATLSALVLFSLFGCASSHSSGPAVEISQLSMISDIRFSPNNGLPIDYQLKIMNPADHDVTLTMVEVESVGEAGAYGLKRVRHAFNHLIPAKSTQTVAFRAWVQRLQQDTRGHSNNAVMIRGSARFENGSEITKTNFVGRTQ